MVPIDLCQDYGGDTLSNRLEIDGISCSILMSLIHQNRRLVINISLERSPLITVCCLFLDRTMPLKHRAPKTVNEAQFLFTGQTFPSAHPTQWP